VLGSASDRRDHRTNLMRKLNLHSAARRRPLRYPQPIVQPTFRLGLRSRKHPTQGRFFALLRLACRPAAPTPDTRNHPDTPNCALCPMSGAYEEPFVNDLAQNQHNTQDRVVLVDRFLVVRTPCLFVGRTSTFESPARLTTERMVSPWPPGSSRTRHHRPSVPGLDGLQLVELLRRSTRYQVNHNLCPRPPHSRRKQRHAPTLVAKQCLSASYRPCLPAVP